MKRNGGLFSNPTGWRNVLEQLHGRRRNDWAGGYGSFSAAALARWRRHPESRQQNNRRFRLTELTETAPVDWPQSRYGSIAVLPRPHIGGRRGTDLSQRVQRTLQTGRRQ
jgi:hypothetical protein